MLEAAAEFRKNGFYDEDSAFFIYKKEKENDTHATRNDPHADRRSLALDDGGQHEKRLS